MEVASIQKIGKFFETNPLRINEAKEQGKKVMGTYCIYSPNEMAMAMGAIPVSLCGTRQDAIPAAESILPRTVCPLIKSSFGFWINDSCAYLAASDLIVGDTTCDGKKKMFELMGEKLNMLILQLPSAQDEELALPFWEKQFEILEERLEKDFGGKITRESLEQAIELANRERAAMKRVMDASRHKPSPITGMQLIELAFKTSFFPDKEVGIKMLEEVADELEGMIAKGLSPYAEATPRVVLTGVPVGIGSHKVIKLLEDCGANVVVLDSCTGYKKVRTMVDVKPGASKAEMIRTLAKRYLDIPCSVMSPNPTRYEVIAELAREFKADAVVDLSWQGCHTYNVEGYSVKKYVTEELGLPALQLETDYSESDTEQLRVRIEAFLEMVQQRKK